jgi:hypothetical protein
VSVFYWVTKYTLGITLKIVFRPRAWGVKNIPQRDRRLAARVLFSGSRRMHPGWRLAD